MPSTPPIPADADGLTVLHHCCGIEAQALMCPDIACAPESCRHSECLKALFSRGCAAAGLGSGLRGRALCAVVGGVCQPPLVLPVCPGCWLAGGSLPASTQSGPRIRRAALTPVPLLGAAVCRARLQLLPGPHRGASQQSEQPARAGLPQRPCGVRSCPAGRRRCRRRRRPSHFGAPHGRLRRRLPGDCAAAAGARGHLPPHPPSNQPPHATAGTPKWALPLLRCARASAALAGAQQLVGARHSSPARSWLGSRRLRSVLLPCGLQAALFEPMQSDDLPKHSPGHLECARILLER